MTEPDLDPVASGFEIAKDGLSGLVVGFDGTDPSRDAVAYAAGIARRDKAWLVVVYVRSSSAVAGLSAAAAAATTAAVNDLADELRAVLDRNADLLPPKTEFLVVDGDPGHEIEQIAQDRRADAIVIGRANSRAHRMIGSVPVRLVRHATRPIIVVP